MISPKEELLLSKGPLLWEVLEDGIRYFYRTWKYVLIAIYQVEY